MLDITEIDRIAYRAAKACLKGIKLDSVHGQSALDTDGKDALRITIVRSGKNAITGDAALDTLVRIQRDLEQAGEDRFAYLKFATEDEMRLNDGP